MILNSAKLPALLGLQKDFFKSYLLPGETALDMTVGNGHDTLFLADLVSESGQVYGFDVQSAALEKTAKKVAGRRGVQLILMGHERLAQALPEQCRGKVGAAMFNLGYLPGSSREIVTRPETTLAALEQLQVWLRPGAGLSIHIYMGHPGGKLEGEAVIGWAEKLPWQSWEVAAYEAVNKAQNREVLLLIVKKQGVAET